MRNFYFLGITVLFFGCTGGLQKKDRAHEHHHVHEHEHQHNSGLPKTGAVVSAHHQASKAGTTVMEEGGNAFDAAVATHFALAVVYPVAGNIGGGGFAVVHQADGSNRALDFREKSPAAYHQDIFLDKEGDVVPEKSLFSVHASGIPGSVEGMWQLHQVYGKLPWKRLLQTSIELADKGFILSESHAKRLNEYQEQFARLNGSDINYLQKAGGYWKEGDLLVQGDLAKLLREIADKGRDGFYRGENAEALIKFIQQQGGLMTQEDLNSYESVWRDVYAFDYKNWKILSMPLPSSGGLLMHQILRMSELKNVKLDGMERSDYVHLLAELERRAYADRTEHLGDPDFNDLDVNELVSNSYLKKRIADISWDHASSSEAILPGTLPYESLETTHYSIIDKEGNAVSITTTINAAYGSRIFVPTMGYVLNNQMDDFSAKPGVPNMFGLMGSEANAIAGGKRPLSSMSPTIVMEGDRVKCILGSPGGSTIITTVLQTILNVTVHEMNMDEAVKAPRFHHQWQPDKIVLEERALDADLIERLMEKGHTIDTVEILGNVNALLIDRLGNVTPGADPRADNAYSAFK